MIRYRGENVWLRDDFFEFCKIVTPQGEFKIDAALGHKIFNRPAQTQFCRCHSSCLQVDFFNGQLLGKNRKLKPTGSERLIWGEGDGSTLTVLGTALGKVGGLICWENYMPLARMAIYDKGVDIYLAPTADDRDTWQATLRHIACEGRCFVLGCNQYMTKDMYPDDLKDLKELVEQPEIMCRGGSAIISPLGKAIAGPLYDKEGILFANLDLSAIARSKFDFDVVGHYARPDVFQLRVNEKPNRSVTTGDKC